MNKVPIITICAVLFISSFMVSAFADRPHKTIYINAIENGSPYNGYTIFILNGISTNGQQWGTIGESSNGTIKFLVPFEVTNSSIGISCSRDNINYSDFTYWNFQQNAFIKTTCNLP